MVSTFVCFQLTFVNQFWYLMLTMFCSQSEMHSRLAAVVEINIQKQNNNPKLYLGHAVPRKIEPTSQTETIITVLLIGF